MTLNAKKLLLAGTALVAVSALGATSAHAVDLSTAGSVTYASAGGKNAADGSTDVINAAAGDNIDIAGAHTLTITNSGTADDGSANTNTFAPGAITNSTGAGVLLVTTGSNNALSVNIDSVEVTSNATFSNTNAANTSNTTTIDDFLVVGGNLALTNVNATGNKAVAVTVGGDLEVTGTTTLTAAAGAGGGANATLNVGGDATLTGVVTLDDSTGTSTITFDGTGGAQTVSGGDIKGASANEGALVFANADGVTVSNTIGAGNAVKTITVNKTGSDASATFTGATINAQSGITIGDGAAANTTTVTFDATGGNQTVTGAIASGGATGTDNIVIAGGTGKTVTFATAMGTNIDTLTINANSTLIANSTVDANTLTLNSGSTLRSGGNATYTADINGAGTLDIDHNVTVVGQVGNTTALTAITVADSKTLTIDAATAGADVTVGASSIVLQDSAADATETVLALTPGAKNITVSAPVTTSTNGDGQINITDSTDDDNVITLGGAVGTSTAKLEQLSTANGGNNVDTVRSSSDLYVNSILLDGSDVLQLRGTAQTVSGTINGNATDSDGFVVVGDGTNAAEVTFGGAIGTTNDIDGFTVSAKAIANISNDLIMASTGANGGLIVDGTLNIDSSNGAITIDNTTNGDIDFNGAVNITGDNSVGIASTDTTTLDGTLSTVLGGTAKTLTLSSDGNHLNVGAAADTTVTAGNQIILNSTATTIGGTGRTTTLLIQKTADFDPTTVAGVDAVLDADTANSVVTIATDGVLNVGISGDGLALANGDIINVIEGGATNATTSYATLLSNGDIVLTDTGLMDLQDNSSDASTLSVKVVYKDPTSVFGSETGADAAETLLAFDDATDELQEIRENLLTASTGEEAQEIAEAAGPTVDGGNVVASMDVSTQVFGVTSTRLASLSGRGGETGMAAGSMPVGSHFWGQVFGQSADQDHRDGVDGYESDTYGLAVGADAEAMDGAGHLGAALSYARTNVDSDNATSTETDIDSYQLTLYGDMDIVNDMYVSGMAAYAWNDNDTQRHDVGGVAGLDADGDFSAHQFSAKFELGRPYAMEGGLVLTPTAMAAYTYYNAEDYTETGAGTANLDVEQDSVSKFDVGVGIDAQWTMQNADGSFLKPGLNAGYRYDLVGDDIQTTSTFTGGGAAFETDGMDPARSQFDVGASIQYLTTNNWDFSAQYNYEIKSDYDAHSGILRAGYKF